MIIGLISTILNVYSLLILLRALLSWFSPNPRHQFYVMLVRFTDPVLNPIRRIVPIQGIDISPMIAILLIDFVIKRILISLLTPLLGY